jgi:hypothetical protein
MIVKILSSSATFSGVIYNTNKIERDKGELMLVRNFGSLQGLGQLRPEDYRNYLKMLSAQNPRVRKPQFHATISAKGRSYDKDALTTIAVQWLEAMGYGEQPYLVVFHKDTSNYHVHVVSTRVDRNARKISSAFENIRAVQQLNKIMGTDYRQNVDTDLGQALQYAFSTRAQFLMILESQGYTLRMENDVIAVIKFGQRVQEIPVSQVDNQAAQYQKDVRRQRQLKAIMEKYSAVYQTKLVNEQQTLAGGRSKVLPSLTSGLSRFLFAKFGIQFLFHAKEAQPAYGYSLIDHAGKAVWKGSEIMPLKDLLSRSGQETFDKTAALFTEQAQAVPQAADPDSKMMYAALLKAAIRNYPDIRQGLHQLGLSLDTVDGKIMLTDKSSGAAISVDDLLSVADVTEQAAVAEYATYQNSDFVPRVSIAEDIDDEQINGRNRRRKKKARTNTR